MPATSSDMTNHDSSLDVSMGRSTQSFSVFDPRMKASACSFSVNMTTAPSRRTNAHGSPVLTRMPRSTTVQTGKVIGCTVARSLCWPARGRRPPPPPTASCSGGPASAAVVGMIFSPDRHCFSECVMRMDAHELAQEDVGDALVVADDKHRQFPVGARLPVYVGDRPTGGTNLWGAMLPYLEQDNLYKKWDCSDNRNNV